MILNDPESITWQYNHGFFGARLLITLYFQSLCKTKLTVAMLCGVVALTAAWWGTGGLSSRRCPPEPQCSRALSCKKKQSKKYIYITLLIVDLRSCQHRLLTRCNKCLFCYSGDLTTAGRSFFVLSVAACVLCVCTWTIFVSMDINVLNLEILVNVM